MQLISTVSQWATRPPWTAEANGKPRTIARLAERAQHKVAVRLERANRTGDVALLHAARKAGKRARYAAEAAAPVTGNKTARKAAKRYEYLQDSLGEHQDSQVSAELLRRLGAKAGTTPGENGFTFGILHEREAAKARDARQEARRIAKRYQ